MTQDERNAILEYERIINRGKGEKMPPSFFCFTEEQNEKVAIAVFKFAFEQILRWSPADIINKCNKETLTKLHLTIPYSKIRFPKELKQNRDYFYLAKVLYPDKVHQYGTRDIVLLMYKAILKNDNQRFPHEYFLESKGDYRARVCLEYVLTNVIPYRFRNVEDCYRTFADKKEGMRIINEYKLSTVMKLIYKDPLDYLHASMPDGQKSDFYYTYYKFMNVYEKDKKLKHIEKKIYRG